MQNAEAPISSKNSVLIAAAPRKEVLRRSFVPEIVQPNPKTRRGPQNSFIS
jgi:hypothetical protein